MNYFGEITKTTYGHIMSWFQTDPNFYLFFGWSVLILALRNSVLDFEYVHYYFADC